jgi:hypothetical protein
MAREWGLLFERCLDSGQGWIITGTACDGVGGVGGATQQPLTLGVLSKDADGDRLCARGLQQWGGPAVELFRRAVRHEDPLGARVRGAHAVEQRLHLGGAHVVVHRVLRPRGPHHLALRLQAKLLGAKIPPLHRRHVAAGEHDDVEAGAHHGAPPARQPVALRLQAVLRLRRLAPDDVRPGRRDALHGGGKRGKKTRVRRCSSEVFCVLS